VLPLAAVAVVVVGVIALAYVLFFKGTGTDSSGGTALPGATSSATAGPSGAAASQPAPAPSGDGGAPSPAAGAASEPAATASVAAGGTVDRTLTLNFFNGSDPQVPGLSRKAAAKFPAKKWKIGAFQAWTGEPVTQTTVFYTRPQDAATAAAVVKVLGVGTAAQATDKGGKGLSVVIFNDYTP
jgi:hypothetical protein